MLHIEDLENFMGLKKKTFEFTLNDAGLEEKSMCLSG